MKRIKRNPRRETKRTISTWLKPLLVYKMHSTSMKWNTTSANSSRITMAWRWAYTLSATYTNASQCSCHATNLTRVDMNQPIITYSSIMSKKVNWRPEHSSNVHTAPLLRWDTWWACGWARRMRQSWWQMLRRTQMSVSQRATRPKHASRNSRTTAWRKGSSAAVTSRGSKAPTYR